MRPTTRYLAAAAALALLAAAPAHAADAFTEFFTFGEPRDLTNHPDPGGLQLTFTPDASEDAYTVCLTNVAVPPVSPDQVTAVALGDDGSVSAPLPVPFTFYGTPYNEVFINANGNLTFGEDDDTFTPSPAAHFALPRISAAFTDLWPDPGIAGQPVGFIGWADLGDRLAVVFDAVPHRSNTGVLTHFNIELFHTGPIAGTVRITWYDNLPPADNVLAGLSPGTGTPPAFAESDLSAYPPCTPPDGVSLAPASAFTPSGTFGEPASFAPATTTYTLANHTGDSVAWSAAVDVPWLSVGSPASGNLADTGNAAITLTLDQNAAAELPPGTYPGALTLTHAAGDPVVRGVTLTVIEGDDGGGGGGDGDNDTYFTEHFLAVVGDPIDLAGLTLCFEPDGSPGSYAATRLPAAGVFPTDPATGTPVGLGDDTYLAVSFTSPVLLYGTAYTSFFISANGRITFTTGSEIFLESLDAHFAQPSVAALFQDLNPGAGGSVLFSELPDRVAVTFLDVPDVANGTPSSFQTELFTDGSGRIQITYLVTDTDSAVVGLSAGPGTTPPDFAEADLSELPVKDPEGGGGDDQLDWGDLPEGGTGEHGPLPLYSTTEATNGPSHTIVEDVFLGATVDAESNGTPSGNATGDDTDQVPDDEDGVTFPDVLHPGTAATVEVVASVPGFLNAWVDWDGDGDFTDPADQIAADLPLNPGANTVPVNVPATAAPPVLFARFRFTTDNPNGELGPGGTWPNGEVEDYALGSVSGTLWFDDGDGIRTEPASAAAPGVTVHLLDGGASPVLDGAGNPVSTTTDSSGDYRFSGLPPGGDYIVAFESPAYPFTAQDIGPDQTDSDADPGSGHSGVLVVSQGTVHRHVDAGLLPATVSFDTAAGTHAESAGTVALTVSINPAQPVPVTVTFTTSGTATVGAAGDLTLSPAASLTIPANTASATLDVTLIDDASDEPDETLTVTLGTPTGARTDLTPHPSHTLTITDNDDPPVLALTFISAVENHTLAEFTVSIPVASGFDITFDYLTAPGTATEGLSLGQGDYIRFGGPVTIPAGSTSLRLFVPLVDDFLYEGDETFDLNITNLQHATLPATGGTITGTITDDDPPPVITVADTVAPETAGTASVVATLSAPSGLPATFTYTTRDITARATGDYTATTGTATVPAGSTSVSIPVTVVDDDLYELDENFRLDLSNPQHATLAAPSASVTISSKPAIAGNAKHAWSTTTGWVDFKPAGGGVLWCGPHLAGYAWDAAAGWLCLGSGNPADGYQYANTSGADFGVNVAPDGKLTGYAWSATTGWVSFEQQHGKPRIDLTPGNTFGKLAGHAWSAATGWIRLDSLAFAVDDPAPTLEIADLTVAESAGIATFTITRSHDRTEVPATATASPVDGTAVAPFDYTRLSVPLTFAPSLSSATINVPVNDDALDEFDETFQLALTNLHHAFFTRPATATVTDDDAAPTLAVASTGTAEGAGSLEFTFTLSAPSGKPVSLDVATRPGTAAGGTDPGDGDFTSTSTTLTFSPGTTTAALQVPLVDDNLDEDDESFSLALSGATNVSVGANPAATIIDNDAPPILSVADASGLEGATANFALSLDTPSGRDITVAYSTADGTATAPADYATASAGTVAIPAGSTTATIAVPLVDDRRFEPAETFTLTPANPSTYNLAPSAASASGTIHDNPTIAAGKAHAWGSTTGWQNWRATPHAGVVVGDHSLAGFLWCATTGWLHLGDASPANGVRYSNTSAADYGVNRARNGELTGQAWSPATGWLTFEQTHGKPKIDPLTGRFSGYAWSATTGWVNLGTGTSHYLQTATAVIADSDGDDIDDGLERDTFGDLDTAGQGTDADRDGRTDLAESIAGTALDDPASVFTPVADPDTADGTITLTFAHDPARLYRIEINPALEPAGWTDSGLGTFPPDPGETTTRTVVLPDGLKRAFARVVPVHPLRP